ncbi:MAG: cellobiose phosphorylase [Lachnospiraceae bacterium]|nr:cellobiose phosphorylase [Lachnospiraceae bacterium]
MNGYEYLDDNGTFRLRRPDQTSYLYFPIAGENGLKGAITPKLSGDLKMDQNTFVLQPVSAEDLMESKAGRNFWCVTDDGVCWSAAGNSAAAEMERFLNIETDTAKAMNGYKNGYKAGDRVTSLTGGSSASTVGKDDGEPVLTAGPMWQCVTRKEKRTGLTASITNFVPVRDVLTEMMIVRIKNTGDKTVRFSPIAAIPLYARSADNIRDHRHVTSLLHRIYTAEDGVFVKPTLTFDERGHQVNTKTYFVTGCSGDGEKPIGFCPVLEDFVGEGGSLLWPEKVVRNLPFEKPGREYAGYEAIGALRFADVTLESGEETAFLIRIGMEEDTVVLERRESDDAGSTRTQTEYLSGKTSADQTRRLCGLHKNGAGRNALQEAESALQETKNYWDSRINVRLQTGNPEFDHWMYWVTFQPILRRIYGCSFLPHHDYGKGGRGWRDLWQDCLALLIMNPDGVRQMIIDNCGGVRMDGTNATIIGSRPGEFIADRNNITRVWMDHGFWPLFTVKFYIDQTGDASVLMKECPYFKDRQEMRGTAVDDTVMNAREAKQRASTENQTVGQKNPDHSEAENVSRPVLRDQTGKIHTGTVLEHLLVQNLTAFYETGEHGHMRLRGADWNDALDMAPDRGESVAFTAAYAMNLQTLAELLLWLKEKTGMTQLEIAREMEILFTAAEKWNGTASDNSTDVRSTVKNSDDAETSEKPLDKIREDYRQKILRIYCASCYPTVSGRSVFLDTEYAAGVLKRMAEQIREHIRKTEWLQDEDCGWFNSYYDNHGRAVERIPSARENGKKTAGDTEEPGTAEAAGSGFMTAEPRMMLTGQVFTIMSGTATEEQTRQIVRAADRWLYKKELGGYRLNTDFKEVKVDLGRMFGFAYGHKENGAVFSHMAVMYGNALYRRGFAKEGYKALVSLFEQASDFEVSRIYPGIPEYFNNRGRGMYHYLTGAASWMMMTVVTEVFGVRGDYGDLVLEPKLMREQFDDAGRAGIQTEFAHKSWNIHYCNRERLDYGEYAIEKVWINGRAQEIQGSETLYRMAKEELERLPEGAAVSVEVELGRKK